MQEGDVLEHDVAADRLQSFVAHLREPASQLVARQADRAAADDQVTGEPPGDDGAGRMRRRLPAVRGAQDVERRERGHQLGRRGEQEGALGMERQQRRRVGGLDRAHVQAEAGFRQARRAQDGRDRRGHGRGGRHGSLLRAVAARRQTAVGSTLRQRLIAAATARAIQRRHGMSLRLLLDEGALDDVVAGLADAGRDREAARRRARMRMSFSIAGPPQIMARSVCRVDLREADVARTACRWRSARAGGPGCGTARA